MRIDLNNILVTDAMKNFQENGVSLHCEDGRVQYATADRSDAIISDDVVGALIYMRGAS